MTRDDWESEEALDPGRPPAPVGDVVRSLTSTRGWQERLRGARVHQVWIEIAGEELARHVVPVRLAGGVLVVRAESPAWATQVRYLAGDLLQRSNAVLGAGQVRTVTVQTGRPDRGRENPSDLRK